ncbi:MAG: DUF2007 domain-containing protein [Planctomycetota bacterium]|nr:MAG: DUF2007 domain-containing protein [Planctomycetota bacterium]
MSMARNDLTVVSRHLDALAAHTVRNRLEAQGIPAVVEGADSQTMLSYIGPALGGVKVLVPSERASEAHAILREEVSAAEPSVPAWTCPRCYSQVDAGFELCWNCGAACPELEPSAEASSEGTTAEGPPESVSSPSTALDGAPGDPRGAANTTATVETRVATELPDEQALHEAVLESAWRAAIIGLCLLPVIAHAYSLMLIAWHAPSLTDLPAAPRRKLIATVIIDAAALVGGALLLRLLL